MPEIIISNQVYEPCDQKDFLAAAAVYVGAGIHNPSGLKFAINVDVAMSEVFLSPATGRGLNERLYIGITAEPQQVQIMIVQPHLLGLDFMAVCPVEQHRVETALLLSTFANNNHSGAVEYIFRDLSRGSSASYPRTLPGFEDPPQGLSISGSVVLAWNAKQACLLLVNATNGPFLDLLQESVWPSNNTITVAAAMVTKNQAACNFSRGVLLAVRVSKDLFGDIWLELWGFPSHLSAYIVSRTKLVACASLVSASVAGGAKASMEGGAFTSAMRIPIVIVYETKYAALKLLTVEYTISCSTGVCLPLALGLPIPELSPSIDAGSRPSISSIADFRTGEILVVETHENGFCANNEKRNKQVMFIVYTALACLSFIHALSFVRCLLSLQGPCRKL